MNNFRSIDELILALSREKVLLKVKKEKINVFTKDGGTNLIRSDAYEKQ